MTVACCSDSAALPVEQENNLAKPAGRLMFSVPGVHCAGCIGRVERTVQAMDGVRDARVNLSLKRLLVEADAALESRIIDRLGEVGYEAQVLDQSKLQQTKDVIGPALLLRMAVAGFAVMNVMLFSVSVWSGAEGETRNLLHWVSALIALPTIAFAGTPFFINAWSALRRFGLNMDVPISLAILLALAMSLFETWVGGKDAYFDAALSLTFFLLLGRYLNHRTTMAARSAASELAALEVKTALLKGDETRMVPIADLGKGDVVVVKPGMSIPLDGRVVAGNSDLNKSLLTGESLPEVVAPGALVYAGTINLTGLLEIEVTGDATDSVLRQMTELVSVAEAARSRFTGLAERAAGIYAPVVHLVSAAAFIGWFVATGDLRLSLNIAVAVLIITCPCALGLAVPAVMTAAVSRLFRAGVLVKDGTAIERLAQIDAVVFDKTGTLTQGTPRMATALPDKLLGVAAGLSAGSSHPLSRAISHAATERNVVGAQVSDITEQPGRGVRGQFEGKEVRLGRADWLGVETTDNAQMQSWLQIGDAAPVSIGFSDPLRADAAGTVADLKAQGLRTVILSGDRAVVADPVGETLGVDQVFADVLPEKKLEIVRATGARPLMVGDGLNDTAAMRGAFVSIAPASAIDAARASADMILLHNNLGEIPRVIALAQQARARILENFSIAAIYNLIAIPLAIMGYASPLAAAIAMSSSSILVSLNALRLLRSAP